MATVSITTGNTYPAVASMREVANKLTHRLPKTVTVSEGFATIDAIKGAPLLTLTDATGVAAFVTMVGLEIPGSKDILGLPQNVYTPHIVKVVARAGLEVSVLYGALLGEIYKLGTKVEFITATTDLDEDDEPTGIPVEDDLANDPAATWVNDPFWSIQNSL